MVVDSVEWVGATEESLGTFQGGLGAVEVFHQSDLDI
jgi:hypothetical protein